MSFDLASLDTLTRSQAGVEMPVLHPRTRAPIIDEDGTPLTITMRGRNSDAYRKAIQTINDRQTDMAARGIAITREEQERDDAELLAAVTVGWTLKMLDGDPFPFSPENARRLWSDRRFAVVKDQATRHIREDANFLPT